MAVLLDRTEHFDAGSARFDPSPVDYGLNLARREEAGWLILLRGTQIRLYSAQPGVGVGSRGPTETFFELDLALLEEDQAGYLDLAFSARALGGGVDRLLEGSRNYAVALGDRLRERIYVEAIPELAVAVAKELERLDQEAGQDLARAYRITLRILFRLLFQAYAEDCGLLPYGANEEYDKYALKRHARNLVDASQKVYDSRSHKIWDELRLMWGVIDTGNAGMDVPAYNGGLFRSDPDRFPDGALISQMRLDDAVVGHALRRLLVDVDANNVPGPVDFRSLSIRDFGTIYEGLLSSSLSRAEQDLTLDKKGTYLPAKAGDKVEVEAEDIYFHNTSGMRKSAGVYFTPRFAVDHLLERSLVPVLRDHLKKIGAMLDEGDEAGAYEAFFDFRVCDPAMGSGNFLVAAIDHIASEMGPFLASRPIQGVTAELDRLESVARKALGDTADQYSLDRLALLRRQIARHCIYGIDNNDIAVDLAKVAVWMHTFVPGLPMSTLDRNLVCADSLTGIGSIEEAIEILDPQRKPGKVSLMRVWLEESLEEARRYLHDAANISEATTAEVKQADEVRDKAIKSAYMAKSILDLAVVVRIGKLTGVTMVEPEDMVRMVEQLEIQEQIRILNPGHMPLLFPEVFLRENSGFDVMIGNPPWDKIKVEEHSWWGLRFPGLRGLSLDEKVSKLAKLKVERPDLVKEYYRDVVYAKESRSIILQGPYPGMGTGDPDLYKAFAWRFWRLVSGKGAVGIVLPHGALNNKGSTLWRQEISRNSFMDVTILENNRGWVFPDIDSRVIVGLFALYKKAGESMEGLSLHGPYRNYTSYLSGLTHISPLLSLEEFMSWTSDLMFLLFPSQDSIDVFSKMSKHPRIGNSPTHPTPTHPTPPHPNPPQPNPTQPNPTQPNPTQPNPTQPNPTQHSTTQSAPNGGIACYGRQAVLSHLRTRWRVRSHRELDATHDRHRFSNMSMHRWPVYGGRSFNIWCPDTSQYYAAVDSEQIVDHLQLKREAGHNTRSSGFSEMPQEWISDITTLPCQHPRVAFRDVTNSTNNRTIIAALVPPNVVLTHKAPYLLWPYGRYSDQAYLLGFLSSMIMDWYARRLVSTHLTFYIFNSLPVPDADPGDPVVRRVVEISGRLAAVDERFADWAAEVGVPVGTLQEEPERSDAIAELDACVALLYGLDEDDLRIIYETFHEKTDYSERHAAVLAHFRRWRDSQ